MIGARSPSVNNRDPRRSYMKILLAHKGSKENSTAEIFLQPPDMYRLDQPWPEGFQPSVWSIALSTSAGGIRSENLGGRWDVGRLDPANFGENGSTSPPDGSRGGTWTVTTPEPSPVLLVGL